MVKLAGVWGMGLLWETTREPLKTLVENLGVETELNPLDHAAYAHVPGFYETGMHVILVSSMWHTFTRGLDWEFGGRVKKIPGFLSSHHLPINCEI